ncbi:hypothetical protein ACF09C_10280 [Streptomyces sp. NPDC014870]|uniref:hypothetical protein n=1 Tax=Streptomyces sp. NPDC014870 TaxID=3364925 RepID=UPI0036FA395C
MVVDAVVAGAEAGVVTGAEAAVAAVAAVADAVVGAETVAVTVAGAVSSSAAGAAWGGTEVAGESACCSARSRPNTLRSKLRMPMGEAFRMS